MITGSLWLIIAFLDYSKGLEGMALWAFISSCSASAVSFLDAYLFLSKKNYFMVTQKEITRSNPFRKPRVISVHDIISAKIVKKALGTVILVQTTGKSLILPRGYYDASPEDIIHRIREVLPNPQKELAEEAHSL